MQYRGEQITAIFRASSFQFKTYFIEKKGVLQGVERKFVGLNNGKNKFGKWIVKVWLTAGPRC